MHKRVRPVSRDNRFQTIRTLKCFSEVYSRICSGWALAEVARFIQDERNEAKAVKRTALEYQLREYRKTIPAADLVAKRFPDVFADAKEKIVVSIDALNELTELYRIQKQRVDQESAVEKRIGKLMSSMTSEIKETRQLLESIANLQMDMGLVKRAAEQVDVRVDGQVETVVSVEDYPESVQGVMNNPESRRRVKGLVDRFIKMGGKDTANLLKAAAGKAAPTEVPVDAGLGDDIESEETEL